MGKHIGLLGNAVGVEDLHRMHALTYN